MRGRRTGAALAVAAATVMVTGAGTAAAGPPGDHRPTRVVEDAAIGSFSTPSGDVTVFLSLFDPPGDEEIGGVEIFGTTPSGDSYECFEGPQISADLDGLRGAWSEGSTTLACGGPDLPQGVVAEVGVDVRWEPYGRVETSIVTLPDPPCVSRTRLRAAEISGLVTVSIPALGVTASVTEGFGDVRMITSICRPLPR
ncbi:hypothetical protein [Blastococcus xanthinilyticus]|uniref:Secreted protein n=1 Tax=Blastococcus xanthinilyticus TaxID=1564164 RepID=A0A5S5CYT2_9ACTN|nr:hypothetical protein [Blastococcus xanthinilyticus]TYP87519.1 hypothetical protein BD833_106107 [Blastococcus xanthinilyticus]